MLAMRNALPADAHWAGFAIARMEMPMVAQAVYCWAATCASASKTTLYLSKGVLASNAQLVEHAVGIIESLGSRVVGPAEARAQLGLRAP